jgi:hypothetical protein
VATTTIAKPTFCRAAKFPSLSEANAYQLRPRLTGMPASATSLRLKVSLFKRQFHLFACDFRMIGQHSRKRRRSSSGLFFAVGDFHKPSKKIDQEGGVPCVIG